jgi:hypothetical protein
MAFRLQKAGKGEMFRPQDLCGLLLTDLIRVTGDMIRIAPAGSMSQSLCHQVPSLTHSSSVLVPGRCIRPTFICASYHTPE